MSRQQFVVPRNLPYPCPASCGKCFQTEQGHNHHISAARSCAWYKKGKLAEVCSTEPPEDELEHEDVLEDLYQEMFELVPAQLDDNYDDDVITELIAGPGPSSRHGLLEDEDDNRVEVVHLTAGKVIRMDSMLHERWQKQFGVQKENEEEEQGAFHPFESCLDWEVACWAREEGIGHRALDHLLAIPGVQQKLGLSYHNTRALHKSLDTIPPRAEWHSKKDHTKSVRIYNEMWSGKWWHAIQVCVLRHV
ncbi:uncharacterized protein EDB91DRAFT_1238463 [Suillus paluster]|uniref:uncharacterized protein n=1 Tax=Suillus paluster TaxID=48578 RepID=UPI001B8845E2|nr:uncharacterized protein EDB91DRAFT_1238463 [Suillus paluster]KAG1734050.1 hypothetical protein EDB91DRAFT_1238463 [Suillus paluster]